MHQVDTYRRSVIGIIPEILLIFLNLFLGEVIQEKLAFFLLNTEHDGSAFAIGKGRICVPKASRKSPCCTFEFQIITFILNEQ